MACRSVYTLIALAMSAATAAACTDQPTAPPTVASARRDRQPGLDPAEIRLVRQLAAQHGIGPLPAAPQVSEPLARLGQALMFDRVLSGNRDMACSVGALVFTSRSPLPKYPNNTDRHRAFLATLRVRS